MASGFYNVPKAVNEPVKSYAPNSPEKKHLLDTYKKMYNEKVDIPFYIGGKEIRTGNTVSIHPPHDHKHTVGHYHKAEKKHVEQAIENALEARETWSKTSRTSIFSPTNCNSKRILPEVSSKTSTIG